MSDEIVNIRCPNCGSARIINQRHDVDWGGHRTEKVNPDECYLPQDDGAGGDIDINTCLECDFIWDKWSTNLEAEREAVCEWRKSVSYDEDTITTACGQEFVFSDDYDDSYSYKFCPECGKPIKHIHPEPLFTEDDE